MTTSADSSSGSPAPEIGTSSGTAKVLIKGLSDDGLDIAYDCALADYALCVKYEHNAHLRPAIEAHLGILDDEYKKRGTQYRFPRSNPSGSPLRESETL